MADSNVPLLKDFDTYARHLPVRRFDSEGSGKEATLCLPLYTVDYLVRPEDLQKMSKSIDQSMPTSRTAVRYLSAPSASGKSSSVLPAFLESKIATHYLYIPFANNGGQIFKAKPYQICTTLPEIAEQQGASFMVQCVKNLLEGQWGTTIPIVEAASLNNSSVQSCTNDLKAFLNEKLGADAYIWFHLDEHGKIIDREYPDIERSNAAAAFSKGAMEVLASLSYSRVVATYTRPPTELPAASSYGVCRFPVALPPFDIDQALHRIPELNLGDTILTSAVDQRLWCTLRFRLAMKIKELGMMRAIHRRGINEIADNFLVNFQRIVEENHTCLSDKLVALNNLCKINLGSKVESNNYAARLLVGANDKGKGDQWIFQERIDRDIIVIEPNGLVTISLDGLLELEDPKYDPYNIGRDLFLKALISEDRDLLSSTPLEYAYFWALATESAVKGSIRFRPGLTFKINCTNLVCDRLLKGTDTKMDKNFLKHMEKNVFYYADETRDHNHVNVEDGKRNPMADLFFVSERNELVLIDVTGGTHHAVLEKLAQKAEWLKFNGLKQNKAKLSLKGGHCITDIRCIILAPNLYEKLKAEDGVDLVYGNDAISLLGGLGQILRWLIQESK